MVRPVLVDASTEDPVQTALNEAVLREARAWIGTPYRHQASLRGVGADCLGLLRGIWRALYGSEPEAVPPYEADGALDKSCDQLAEAGRRWFVEKPLEERQPADILLFRWRDHLPARHVAILAGPSSLIHAYERIGVVESPFASAWQRRLAHVFSFPSDLPDSNRKARA
ncbi:MAG: peptidase P60 [Rhodobacteraceae bacterium]|nr:peptidase P60 [Paracoccaceae bacterium]